MQAVRATITGGTVHLEKPLDIKGPVEAIVVVLDPDPWEALIRDPRPRSGLAKASRKALEEFCIGETTPLDFEKRTQ